MKLAKAANYGLNHWTALTRFLKDARLGTPTICASSSFGLWRSAERITCRGLACTSDRCAPQPPAHLAQHGVPPLPYLTDVPRKLANGWQESRLSDRWQLVHGAGSNNQLPGRTTDGFPNGFRQRAEISCTNNS